MNRVQELIQTLKIKNYLNEVETFIGANFESEDQEQLFEAINLVLESEKFEDIDQKLAIIDELVTEASKKFRPTIVTRGRKKARINGLVSNAGRNPSKNIK
ncbi:MAG: hypothetical protein H7836_04710 [Magnetococcus sp. YQC-3]